MKNIPYNSANNTYFTFLIAVIVWLFTINSHAFIATNTTSTPSGRNKFWIQGGVFWVFFHSSSRQAF